MKKMTLFTDDFSLFEKLYGGEQSIKDQMEELEWSGSYEDFIHNQMEIDWDDFLVNLSHSKYDTACVVDGYVGRWDGDHDVIPTTFDSLSDAIRKISDCNCDNTITIDLDENHIVVHQSHHDGHNRFDIYVLNGDAGEDDDLLDDKFHTPIDYLF